MKTVHQPRTPEFKTAEDEDKLILNAETEAEKPMPEPKTPDVHPGYQPKTPEFQPLASPPTPEMLKVDSVEPPADPNAEVVELAASKTSTPVEEMVEKEVKETTTLPTTTAERGETKSVEVEPKMDTPTLSTAPARPVSSTLGSASLRELEEKEECRDHGDGRGRRRTRAARGQAVQADGIKTQGEAGPKTDACYAVDSSGMSALLQPCQEVRDGQEGLDV